MADSKAVKERIAYLITQAAQLSKEQNRGAQMAWLTAAENSVLLVSPSSPYSLRAKNLALQADMSGALRSSSISQMAALLSRLLEEIEGGLLTTVENHVIAATFDDFLNHGAEYLKHGRKDEAGVIAGIVFEDTIRRICRTMDIGENGVALETLIADLVERDVLTALKAKRARAAAGLRTSAAHARWEEFEIGDVTPVIEFTKELIAAHLG